MKTAAAACAALLLLPPAWGGDPPEAAATSTGNWSASLKLQGSHRHANDASAFAPAARYTGAAADEHQAALELRGQTGPLRGVVTTRGERRTAQDWAGHWVVNELVLESALPGTAAYYSVGKKMLSWDVGYAWRPLDVLQREDRRTLVPVTLEGIPQLCIEWFGADSAVALLLTNPGKGRAARPRDDAALTLRAFRRAAASDLYGLARWSERYGVETGGAFSHVLDESLELHGSALWQQRFERWRNAGNGAPWQVDTAPAGHKLLLGATWTNARHTSIILEAWYDRSGLTAAQWRSISADSRALALQPLPAEAIAGLSARGAEAYRTETSARSQVFLRLSQKLGDVEIAADQMRSPADGGHVTTLAATWIRNAWRLDAGLRRFGGPGDSAWGNAPSRHIWFAQVQLGF